MPKEVAELALIALLAIVSFSCGVFAVEQTAHKAAKDGKVFKTVFYDNYNISKEK